MVTKGERDGGGMNQEFGINRYTLLYVKQINNKDLPCSTGNYIQYIVITYNGKESEKVYFPVHVKLTKHCKLTTLKFKQKDLHGK